MFPLTDPDMYSECAICAPGYGRGVGNACHECTAVFKGGMYFLLAVGLLLTIMVGLLLAVYLVRGLIGGRGQRGKILEEQSAGVYFCCILCTCKVCCSPLRARVCDVAQIFQGRPSPPPSLHFFVVTPLSLSLLVARLAARAQFQIQSPPSVARSSRIVSTWAQAAAVEKAAATRRAAAS